MSNIQKSVNSTISDLDSTFRDLSRNVENQFDELMEVIEEKDDLIEKIQTELAEQEEYYEGQINDLREELRKVSFLLIEYQHQNKAK
jgi:protein-arginine kinase